MSATARATQANLTIEDLRQMNFKELEALYRDAPRPATLADLNGDALGAMLAWRSPATGLLAALLRSFGSSSVFPWKGKTFKNESGERGEGINRIDFGFMKTQWFRFGTRFDSSFLDGKPSFVLDYSRPGNPPLIRDIVDEVREVAPGLYLGPAALKVKGKPRPVLFFSVYFPQ